MITSTEAEPHGSPPPIEVGLDGGDVRYWRAGEAVRLGEKRLEAQNAIRTAMEARATAITGWGAVGLLAATGAAFTAKDIATLAGSIVAAAVLFVASVVAIHAARPRDWTMAGYDPNLILASRFETELEEQEATAKGYSPGIQDNNHRLNGMGRMIRLAGALLISAPILGGIAYSLAPVAISLSLVVLQRFR